jgi:hypothetical protein
VRGSRSAGLSPAGRVRAVYKVGCAGRVFVLVWAWGCGAGARAVAQAGPVGGLGRGRGARRGPGGSARRAPGPRYAAARSGEICAAATEFPARSGVIHHEPRSSCPRVLEHPRASAIVDNPAPFPLRPPASGGPALHFWSWVVGRRTRRPWGSPRIAGAVAWWAGVLGCVVWDSAASMGRPRRRCPFELPAA